MSSYPFDPRYDWTVLKETEHVLISTCPIGQDLRILVQFKKKVMRPQANNVIYRFYDFIGVMYGWKKEFPRLTPLNFSYRRFMPLRFENSNAGDGRCFAYIYLEPEEQGAVYDIMEAYDEIFSRYTVLRGL